jgi:hypothetical protein
MINYGKIRDILIEHKGKKNKITSKQISLEMGFPMEDTQSISRKAIWETAEKYGLPLISSTTGYYLANTKEELEEYNKNIDKRIDGMKKTRDMVNKNFKEWNQ